MTCRARCACAGVALALLGTPATGFAQVDPLLFMKTEKPNVVFVVDTAARMQRGAPTDPSTPTTARATSDYYDTNIYTRTGAAWETGLGVTAAMTTYRRLYKNLDHSSSGNGDKYTTTTIQVVGSNAASYSRFEGATRLAVARAAMYQVVNENNRVARFGLVKTRQKSPAVAVATGPVGNADLLQQVTETGSVTGKWDIFRPSVDSGTKNGAWTTSGLLIQADSATANTDVLTILGKDVRQSPSGATPALMPAGNDDSNTFDTPVSKMLDDAKTEVTRLIGINNDPACRNTIVVLIVGGGEGNTTTGVDNATLGTTATTFTNISGRRVPIYVIAIAPPTSDVASLKAIAANSGGQYFEITSTQVAAALASPLQTATPAAGVTVIAPTGTVIVPEVVKAISIAVQHTFATSTDFSATPATLPRADATLPVGIVSEYQVTSPIVGTVNLNNAKDITGANVYTAATQPPMVVDKSNNVIPQRNNILVTTGVSMPGFDAELRAFVVYKPVADATQATGWKFSRDGTRLWLAATPAESLRNLFTADASGNLVAFTSANAATLAPLMGVDAAGVAISSADADAIISYVRSQSLGAVLDSTPAIMNPPSLDPAPDDAYPGFAVTNKGRRTILWVGTNRGIFEAIDARTGLELWGFIPTNLLPKLRTLRDGQPVGTFDFFMDGSPKISDVNVPGICDADHRSECWRTHLIIGEGPGGTFYHSLDVTLDGMEAAVAADSDDQTAMLNYFSTSTRIRINWTFPAYSSFDAAAVAPQHCDSVTDACDSLPYGELKAAATAIEKTVGQTWSDPAVGQIATTSGPYSVLLGSGFLPYATQQANRGGAVAGTTFYILNSKTGAVYASSNIGSDGVNETVNNCQSNPNATGPGCKKIKNALQTDAVATGPSDQRYITKAYLGDLDGNVWRFTIGLDISLVPTISASTKLYSSGSDQPIFSSMATVNVGSVNQYIFFGTGSDLLPATDKNTVYHLLGVLDTGAATGTKSVDRSLAKSNSTPPPIDERVTAFPAVAGDIVFFTTTTLNSATFCSAPAANLYAFTFTGGAAYDTNNSGTFTNADSVLVKTIAGLRATAPFIVDQHLLFGSGKNVSVFGNQDDYNNGVGQAGVRILSWREVR